jgi:hypothetical protein
LVDRREKRVTAEVIEIEIERERERESVCKTCPGAAALAECN